MTSATPKTVHVTNYFHESSGGISTVLRQVLKQANLRERHHTLIVPGKKDEEVTIGRFGRIFRVRSIRSPLFDRRYRLLMPWQYIPEGSAVREILTKERPDVIEIADKYTLPPLAGMIARGYFRPLRRPALALHSCERFDDNLRAFIPCSGLSGRFPGYIAKRFLFSQFDYHIANSGYTASEIGSVDVEERPGAGVFISPCGVDKVFTPERKSLALRRRIAGRFGFSEDATIVLYVSRLSKEKNPALLYRFARSLASYSPYDRPGRSYHFLVAGDGPLKKWLQRKLDSLEGVESTFVGHLSGREELADIYANSDVFVHTNPREPFGIAPLEAMASGVPAILPKSGGVLTYANQDNAWLCEPDEELYFAALMRILEDTAEREDRVRNALKTAKAFSEENAITRLFGIYDEIFRRHSARESASMRPPQPVIGARPTIVGIEETTAKAGLAREL